MRPLNGFIGVVLAALGGYMLVTHATPDAFHVTLAALGALGGATYFFISRAYGTRHILLNMASGITAGLSANVSQGLWPALGWMVLGLALADIGGCLLGYAFRRTDGSPQQPGP